MIFVSLVLKKVTCDQNVWLGALFFFSKFYIACESVQTFFQVIYFWETFFGSFWRRGELFWLF